MCNFQADLGDGRVETWWWRLFASRRDLMLEIENKYQRLEGKTLRIAGVQALDDFIRVWDDGAK